jgi:hypothetical protein
MQAEDEDQILAQAEEILEARKAEAAAKRPQGAPLLHPASFSNSISELPFFDHTVVPMAPPKPGVYLRRAMVEESKKAAVNQAAHSQKVSKTLEVVLADTAKVAPSPTMMTRAVTGMFLALHSEALHLVELKLHNQRAAGKVAGEEGRGKRTIKAKNPRYEEPLPPHPSKRNRPSR